MSLFQQVQTTSVQEGLMSLHWQVVKCSEQVNHFPTLKETMSQAVEKLYLLLVGHPNMLKYINCCLQKYSVFLESRGVGLQLSG